MKLIEDIRSVTDLKRKTREILDQLHETGRPVVLTVHGKADAVLMNAKTFDKHLSASNMAKLLAPAEAMFAPAARPFLNEFKRGHKVPR